MGPRVKKIDVLMSDTPERWEISCFTALLDLSSGPLHTASVFHNYRREKERKRKGMGERG